MCFGSATYTGTKEESITSAVKMAEQLAGSVCLEESDTIPVQESNEQSSVDKTLIETLQFPDLMPGDRNLNTSSNVNSGDDLSQNQSIISSCIGHQDIDPNLAGCQGGPHPSHSVHQDDDIGHLDGYPGTIYTQLVMT